ncbi:DUF2158 domain-containing protein [Sphingobium sp. BHU LFT2]|uniref:YodC family protein n=1 Tax=Sphingobium sp. BHU LFT2 TaxID=2807634 RepID=UPI001BEB93CA|nr:DUF2158 domain-containing protein [Sphingobium sp. BHU LFT2]MBT2242672.1 DUF2158 domain-containing protein [Sphingobium sp. BHU LFT2]
MADTPFEIGDVVQLKSGGPKMTVTSVGTGGWSDGPPTHVYVSWFAGSEAKSDSFPFATVEKI